MAARNLITRFFSSVSVSSRPTYVTHKHEIGGTRIVLDEKWCDTLIHHYVKKASIIKDEDISTKAFNEALSLLLAMRSMSFEVKENTYEPLMRFITERRMEDEFRVVHDHFKKEHWSHLPKLAYYEALLSIRLKDECNIQRLMFQNHKGEDESVGYMEALSEDGRKKDVLKILSTFDILKVSSQKNRETLFKALGMLQLEPNAKSFILELQAANISNHDLSSLICIYATNIPMQIHETVEIFKNLQAELKVKSSAVSFQKLIETCCDMREVSLALKLASCMLKDNLRMDIKTFDSILTACDKNCDYHLVNQVYSMISEHYLLPNHEMLIMMINMYIKMNRFEEVYDMIKESKRFGLYPNASMYNAIISGYRRMNEFDKGLAVLEVMFASNVKPDPYTFRLIISCCYTKELIEKYLKIFEDYPVSQTKQGFCALVIAYISSGSVDKAKQVLENNKIPFEDLKDIKSVLVSELATKGHMSDALSIYKEMRQDGENLEPKAVLVLIQRGQYKCDLPQLLELLDQLKDSELWVSGCDKILLFCVRHKLLSSTIDLLKQRVRKAANEIHIESIFYGLFAEIADMEPAEPADIQFGLDLLRAMRDDMGIASPRQCIDFLLSASVKAKEGAVLVWKEYELAGLSYNPVTFLRMHQALLASGQHEQADLLLQNMPRDDSHAHSYITYIDPLIELSKSTLGGETVPK